MEIVTTEVGGLTWARAEIGDYWKAELDGRWLNVASYRIGYSAGYVGSVGFAQVVRCKDRDAAMLATIEISKVTP